MKVLHVDTGRSWRGGQAQVFHLVHHLHDQSVGNHLLLPRDSELAERVDEENGPVQMHHHPLRGEWDLAAAWRIHSIVREEDIALVHAHDSNGHGICWLASRLFASPPLVVTRRLELPVAQNTFSRWKYEAVDQFIAISPAVKQALVDCGMEAERVAVIPSGTDVDEISETRPAPELLEDLGIDPERPVIGNVGALTEQKDQATFIRAADRVLEDHPDAQFVIAGKGELEEDLRHLINELDRADRVILAGFQENIIGLIKTFDLFVLTSIFEGLCSTLLQVMACRVPIVATEVGGVPNIVRHDETGRLTSPESPGDTAAEITAFLNDDHPYDRYVEEAYDQAQSYDYPNLARRTADLYRDLNGGE